MNYIIAFVIFGVIVLVHEFGHYIVAKKGGIYVEEFAIGMGPKIVGFTRNGTLYSIRLLPIGGFCKMLGEDDDVVDERAFNNKSVWVRISTIFAGPLFNFILAFVIAAVIIIMTGYSNNTVERVMEDFPAEQAGVMPGDRIVKVNGKKMYTSNDISFYTSTHQGETLELTLMRDKEQKLITVTPQLHESGRYLIGIEWAQKAKANPLQVLEYSYYEVRFWIKATVESIGSLVTGNVGMDQVAGPVGIIGFISDSYEESIKVNIKAVVVNLLTISLLLSANLGVMNLLPIPALDGSRLVFLLIEAIRGKPIDRNKEGFVHFVGFVLLMGLMVLLLFNDIKNLFA